jgi:hypothetical protein
MRARRLGARVTVVGVVVAAATLFQATAAYAASAIASVEHTAFGDVVRYFDYPFTLDSDLVVRSNATGFVLDQAFSVSAGTGCHHPNLSDLSLVSSTETIALTICRVGRTTPPGCRRSATTEMTRSWAETGGTR